MTKSKFKYPTAQGLVNNIKRIGFFVNDRLTKKTININTPSAPALFKGNFPPTLSLNIKKQKNALNLGSVFISRDLLPFKQIRFMA